MSSIANSDTLAWSDEQTRFYLQLRLDEELKGNIRKGVVNDAGRRTIIEKFFEAYGERHVWRKFGIKYSTCKTQYDSFKKLTHNKTGLGYHPNGFLDMSEDWWNNRIKEWSRARKIKDKALANMDLMEKIFGSVNISGAEGWTAQQGEDHLDTMHPTQDAEGESESRQIPPTQDAEAESQSRQIPPTQDVEADMSNGPSSSSKPKASRKRSRIVQAGQAVAKVIRDSVQSRDNILSHKNTLIVFVEMVAQDLTVRVIAERYQRSLDTVKRKLDDVLSALLKLASDTLKPTRDEFKTPSRTLVESNRYMPYFRDCIGALDGTHVPVRPPSGKVELYRGRKAEATMNVLAICNFSMKFIYAYVGAPGRAHDTKVLTYCATQEASFPHPPPGKYYLVDSGYPTRSGGYLGPHRKTRYHLDLFNRGGPPTNSRELFNRKHSSLRSIIERTFGVWKAKWRTLDRKHPKYELKKWIKIVTATMALHNFIRDSQEPDSDFEHWETMEAYEQHGDDIEEHVPYVPTGDRAMEALRDALTVEMAEGTRLPY